MDSKSDFILDILISRFAFHYGFIFSSTTSLLSLFLLFSPQTMFFILSPTFCIPDQ
jgi:hypothetical protein